MGCTLLLPAGVEGPPLPCHGASFDLKGAARQRARPWKQTGGYRGDASAYPVSLPALARPRVKVENGQVFVWTAQV